MKRTLIKDLSPGQVVSICGWVHEIRNLSKIKFLVISDMSGTVQAVVTKGQASFNETDSISPESVIELTGTVKENKESRTGIEILADGIKMLSRSSVPLPIDISERSSTGIDKRIDYRFLDTRSPKNHAVFRVRSKIFRIITDFLDDNGFVNINTPKLTSIGVESGAQLFTLDYFGRQAYLAQSPQIYKQMFVAGGFERVYEIGPVFRAEKSHTKRHLTEFTGIDFEMGFIRDENDIMDMIEKMYTHLLHLLVKEAGKELSLLNVAYDMPERMPRITMKEAKILLRERGRDYSDESDLDSEGEKLLGEIAREKYKSDFVFLTRFPWAVRPFYHMRPEDNQSETRSFDLLLNGVEICTGAQREHRLDVLMRQAEEKGLDLGTMKEYKEIFMYGIPPHGGVGFGLDRITQRILKLENIRDAVLLPRDPERIRP